MVSYFLKLKEIKFRIFTKIILLIVEDEFCYSDTAVTQFKVNIRNVT